MQGLVGPHRPHVAVGVDDIAQQQVVDGARHERVRERRGADRRVEARIAFHREGEHTARDEDDDVDHRGLNREVGEVLGRLETTELELVGDLGDERDQNEQPYDDADDTRDVAEGVESG